MIMLVNNNTYYSKEKRITKYYGIVTGETIIGANLFRDFLLVFVTL